jgi:hypothetical protein
MAPRRPPPRLREPKQGPLLVLALGRRPVGESRWGLAGVHLHGQHHSDLGGGRFSPRVWRGGTRGADPARYQLSFAGGGDSGGYYDGARVSKEEEQDSWIKVSAGEGANLDSDREVDRAHTGGSVRPYQVPAARI